MLLDEGGGPVDQEADATFLGGEDTLHEFSPEKVEQAQRLQYRADESGVVFALVVSGEALNSPDLIATVARQWAATWNINAAVPGVMDIAETQRTRPLGALEDVVQVAVESTSGKNDGVLTLSQREVSPDVFAAKVKAYRAQLTAMESV